MEYGKSEFFPHFWIFLNLTTPATLTQYYVPIVCAPTLDSPLIRPITSMLSSMRAVKPHDSHSL